MKTLQEQVSLAGKTEEITITELRARPGDVLAQVELGKTFHIKRRNKIIAVLAQPEPSAVELGAEIRRLKLQ